MNKLLSNWSSLANLKTVDGIVQSWKRIRPYTRDRVYGGDEGTCPDRSGHNIFYPPNILW